MAKRRTRHLRPLQTKFQQPAEFHYPPSQANLSLSQQQYNHNTTVNSTVIVSPNEAIADLQAINAFSDQDKEWVKNYIEKEQAHRHKLDDKKLNQEKDMNDKILKITGRSQYLGIIGGGIITLAVIGIAAFFVIRGCNLAAIVAFMGALLPFASAFSKNRRESKEAESPNKEGDKS